MTMSKLISCQFNIDTACVELVFDDGSQIYIDCTAVENEVADNRFQRSELDYLIYNDPLAYADLVLNGDPEAYLKAVTEYKPFDSRQNEYSLLATKAGRHRPCLPVKISPSFSVCVPRSWVVADG